MMNHHKIVIEYNGDITTAKMVVNGSVVKTTTAKRNPADKPNFRTGAQTAFDRLWQKQPKQPKPEKPAEKDGFKVGDRVVCVSDHYSMGNSVGEHGRVVVIDEFGQIGVEFDRCQPEGHHCGGKAKPEYGRWHSASELRHEQPTKQKVKEVKRQANAGEYIKLTEKSYSFDKVGLILRVDKVNGCALVLQKNHPTSNTNSHPEFPWAYSKYGYVVLEGYKPGRDE